MGDKDGNNIFITTKARWLADVAEYEDQIDFLILYHKLKVGTAQLIGYLDRWTKYTCSNHFHPRVLVDPFLSKTPKPLLVLPSWEIVAHLITYGCMSTFSFGGGTIAIQIYYSILRNKPFCYVISTTQDMSN